MAGPALPRVPPPRPPRPPFSLFPPTAVPSALPVPAHVSAPSSPSSPSPSPPVGTVSLAAEAGRSTPGKLTAGRGRISLLAGVSGREQRDSHNAEAGASAASSFSSSSPCPLAAAAGTGQTDTGAAEQTADQQEVNSSSSHNDQTAASTTLSSSPTPSGSPSLAQLLFTDGLLTIFSFLSFPDLLPVVHSCKSWRAAAFNLKCRSIHLPLAPVHLVASAWSSVSSSPLRHHIVSMEGSAPTASKYSTEPLPFTHALDFAPLESLDNLTKLTLHDFQFNEVELRSISQVASLRYLEAGKPKYTPSQLAALCDSRHSKLRQLEELCIRWTELTAVHMESLCQLPSLTALSPKEFGSDALQLLPRCSRLRSLMFTTRNWGGCQFGGTVEGICRGLVGCAALTSLQLQEIRLEVALLAVALTGLPKLTQLFLDDAYLDREDLSFLPKAAPQLQELKLYWLRFSGPRSSRPPYDFALLQPLFRLQQLRSLTLTQICRLSTEQHHSLTPPSSILPQLMHFSYNWTQF